MNDPRWSDAVDPYAPPKAAITPGASEDLESAEVIRRELLKHETSIKSVGFLYLLSAAFMGLAALSLIVLSAGMAGSSDVGVSLVLGLVYGALAAISFFLGRGLRQVDPKVRLGVTILSVIGLIGIPFGTLINGYILYLLHSEKGKRVMTADYQAIIVQTPHIKYRTPLWLIVLAVLVIVGFFALIYFAASS